VDAEADVVLPLSTLWANEVHELPTAATVPADEGFEINFLDADRGSVRADLHERTRANAVTNPAGQSRVVDAEEFCALPERGCHSHHAVVSSALKLARHRRWPR